MSEDWTLASLIGRLAERGEAPAILAMAGEELHALSGAELALRSRRLAAGLVAAGVAIGEPVGLIGANGPDWLVARFALGLAGALAVAFDDLAAEAELRAVLADAGCRRILCAPGHVETLRRIDPRFTLVVLDDAPPPETIGWRSLFAEPDTLPALPPDAPAMLVHTSGTTGAPKGFVLTYANLWANVGAVSRERLIGAQDRVLLPLPLHHVYPFVVGVLTVLSCGATLVFPEAVAGPQILRALRVGEVTVLIGVPRLLAAITAGIKTRIAASGRIADFIFTRLIAVSAALRRRFGIAIGGVLFGPVRRRIGPKLRMLVSGGAKIDPELLWPLVGLGYEVRSGYGLAETSSIFTGNLPGRERLGSEGRPFAGNQLRLVQAENPGNNSGDGEIQLKGPAVFAAYRNNREATDEAFTPDGWFRTGDLGRLDADGFLYVTGRSKETLVLGGGKKVHPEELEKQYGASTFIREIAVLERRGSLAALVVPDLDAIRAGGRVGIEDVIRVELASRAQMLPSYERLAGFALSRDPLPRTRLGKIQRFRLAELYEQARSGGSRTSAATLSDADRALLAEGRAGAVLVFLQARYPAVPVAPDTHPALDLGIDSLEWMSLALALEERFGIRLREEDIEGIGTIRDLLRFAADSAGSAGSGARIPEDLGDEDLAWLRPAGPGLCLLGYAIYALDWLAARALFRLSSQGREHLPKSGPFIILANHASDLDALVLAAAVGWSKANRLAWSGDVSVLFRRRSLHPVLRAVHVFPVDERRPAKALAMAAEVLRRGSILVWFPESWRSPDGQMQRFLPGIGKLLLANPVPVVPLHIDGTFEAMPRGHSVPRLHKVRLRFGPPVDPASFADVERNEAGYQEIANRFRAIVAELGRVTRSGRPD